MPRECKRLPIESVKELSSVSAQLPMPVPTVSQQNGLLLLHFESDYIQSQMIVDEPEFLALAYTRTMMAFEMFKPRPREIALIGLGGGSIGQVVLPPSSK